MNERFGGNQFRIGVGRRNPFGGVLGTIGRKIRGIAEPFWRRSGD